MNKIEIEKLYEKRVYAYFIDMFVVFLVFIPLLLDLLQKSNLTKFFLIVILYYIFIPILTKGRTLGLYIMNLKIVFLEEKNTLNKVYLLFFRSLYSILTLYIFRVFTFSNMNNLGQLNFDERFNIAIINKEDKLKNEEEITTYYLVNFNPFYFLKIFGVLIIFGIVKNLLN